MYLLPVNLTVWLKISNAWSSSDEDGDSVIPIDSKFQNWSRFGLVRSGASTVENICVVTLTPRGAISGVLGGHFSHVTSSLISST